MPKQKETITVVVDASEVAPLEDVITENTLHIEERKGKYSNSIAVGRYCNCLCHYVGQNIMHCMPCCNHSGKKRPQRALQINWHRVDGGWNG